MTIEQLIVLALIQGVTEFLPVSSSAHLILLPEFTNWADQGPLLDLAVHAGSLGAVMIYFKRDVVALFAGMGHFVRGRSSTESRLLLHLIIATLPVLAAGAIFKVTGLAEAVRSIEVIGWMTLVFGAVLYVADIRGSMEVTIPDLKHKGALWIGLAQCLALFPGTSRSGITITAARAMGMGRREAAHFSMLLALPTISIFALVAGYEVAQSGDAVLRQDVLIAMALSFISALAAISIFMNLLKRMSLLPFVIYRMVLGVGLLSYVYFF